MTKLKVKVNKPSSKSVDNPTITNNNEDLNNILGEESERREEPFFVLLVDLTVNEKGGYTAFFEQRWISFCYNDYEQLLESMKQIGFRSLTTQTTSGERLQEILKTDSKDLSDVSCVSTWKGCPNVNELDSAAIMRSINESMRMWELSRRDDKNKFMESMAKTRFMPCNERWQWWK